MPARLGPLQLQKLRALGPHLMQVVADDTCKRLEKRGLLTAAGAESFYHLSPNGLRALADALEAGKVLPIELPKKPREDRLDPSLRLGCGKRGIPKATKRRKA